MAESLMSVNNVPLTGLRRKWLWPHASPEGEFIKNSQLQERVVWGGEKTKFVGQMPTTQTWTQNANTRWDLAKCPNDIVNHSVFFLKKHCKGRTYINGISTTSSNVGCILPPHQIISHIAKQNYILHLTFFFFFQRPCHQMWLGNVKTKRD